MNHGRLFLVLGFVLASAGWVAAAERPIVGRWDCVATMPGGGETKWTLTVQEQDGKLTGTAGSEEGDLPITDPKYENDTFSFKVVIDSDTYEVQVRVTGARFEGSWKGGGQTGSLKGVKKT